MLVALAASSAQQAQGAPRRDRPLSCTDRRSRWRDVKVKCGRRRGGAVGIRLLKVNEGIREVVSQRAGRAQGSAHRLRHRDRRRDDRRPAARHGVRQRARRRASEREASLAALRAAHGVLQARVAAALRMKRTPQLEFVYDATVDTAMRVESLIRRYEARAGRAIVRIGRRERGRGRRERRRAAVKTLPADVRAVCDALREISRGRSRGRAREPRSRRAGGGARHHRHRHAARRPRRGSTSPPASSCRATASFSTTELGGTRRAAGGRRAARRRQRLVRASGAADRRLGWPAREHRPPSRQHALRRRRAGARRGQQHSRDRLRVVRGARADAVAAAPPPACTPASRSTPGTSATPALGDARSRAPAGWSRLGVDPTAVYRELYERRSLAGLALCGRGRSTTSRRSPAAGR